MALGDREGGISESTSGVFPSLLEDVPYRPLFLEGKARKKHHPLQHAVGSSAIFSLHLQLLALFLPISIPSCLHLAPALTRSRQIEHLPFCPL